MNLAGVYLALTFLSVNIVHSYLLVSQKSSRGLTISQHAAKTVGTHRFYIYSHIIAAIFFTLFALEIFLIRYNIPALFYLSVLGALTECLQALIPARGRKEKYHTAAAYFMSALVTFLGIMSAFLLPVDETVKIVILIIGGMILCGYPLAVLLPRKYFWIIEMVNINLFFVQMMLMSSR